VLVVDDVADARELVSTILTLGGYTVVEAATGNEALQRVEEAPDLVVLDVHLPDIDGFEVCRRIKSDPRSATTPVVQISAVFSRTEHRVRGLTGGLQRIAANRDDDRLHSRPSAIHPARYLRVGG